MEEQALLASLINLLLHVGVAIGVGLLGLMLARWVRRKTRQLVANPRVSENLGPSVRELISRIAFYAVLILALGAALIALGVPTTYVIGGMALILVILGVALQQSLADLTATIIFFTYQPFRRDELIQTMGYTGVVQEIQLFNTTLFTADQRLISLANSKVQEAGVVNYSRAGTLRADVEFTLAYTADLSEVRTLLLDLVRQDARVLDAPAPDVIVLEVRDNGVRLALRAFASNADYWQVLFDLRERATARLADAGIEFAREQSTVTVLPDRTPPAPRAES